MPLMYYQMIVLLPITLIISIAIYLTYTSTHKVKFLASSILSIFSLHFILLPILALVILGKDGLDNEEHFNKVLLLSAFLQIVICIPLLFWLSKAFKSKP
jgi:cytochrome bd-type quinol oxidase subunit 2